jgi:hypothetical protein
MVLDKWIGKGSRRGPWTGGLTSVSAPGVGYKGKHRSPVCPVGLQAHRGVVQGSWRKEVLVMGLWLHVQIVCLFLSWRSQS